MTYADDYNTPTTPTPLLEAISLPDEREALGSVRKLLDAGEDPNRFDHFEQVYPVEAAWNEAAIQQRQRDPVLEMLLERGADVGLIRKTSDTLTDPIVRGPLGLTLLMFEHGLTFEPLYTTTELGERVCSGMDNPLTMLIEEEAFDTIERLTPHGIMAFINAYNDLGESPLGSMARLGNRRGAQWLLDRGADINLHSESLIGDTPLDRAVHEHDTRMIEFLLRRGANPNIPTWMWITAPDRVCDPKNDTPPEITRMVMEACVRFPAPTYPNGMKPTQWPPKS